MAAAMPDTDGWPLHHGYRGRSKSRERDVEGSARRGPRGGETAATIAQTPDLRRFHDAKGNSLLRRRMAATNPKDATYSSFEVNMLKSKQNSSQKPRMPIKALIEEEMSRDSKQRRVSPSVIARLMGLDGLSTPSSVDAKCIKDTQTSSYGMSDVCFKERYSPEDYPNRSGDDQQKFKDVYEITEVGNMYVGQNQPIKKGLPKSIQRENEFEPNSLFRKHLQDLQSMHSKPQSSHITLLKPSKISRLDSHETQWASDNVAKSYKPKRKDVMNEKYKYNSVPYCDLMNKRSLFASHKSGKSEYEGKVGHHPPPTRIVVLKPTDEKMKIDNRFSCPEKASCSSRRWKTCHTHKLLSGERDLEKLPDNIVTPRHKATYSLMSKEASISMGNVERNGSLKALATVCNESDRNEHPQQKRGKYTLQDDGFLISEQCDDWRDSCTFSSFPSVESSVSREARKHLSEQWKMSNMTQNTGFPSECSSTLGEMLSLSDREFPCLAGKKDFHPRLDCPSGISSNDGWKYGHLRKLPRSRSLLASGTFPTNSRWTKKGSLGDGDFLVLKDVLNLSSNKSPEVDVCCQNTKTFQSDEEPCSFPSVDPMNDEGYQLPEPNESYHRNCLTGVGHETCEPSTTVYYDATALIEDITTEKLGTSACEIDVPSELNKDKLPPSALHMESSVDIADDPDNTISKEIFVEHPFAESVCNSTSETESPKELNSNAGEPESLISCKDYEQPSPVSVLESLDEEQGKSSPNCFERLSADLQGLRLQLQILKSEFSIADVEGIEVSSDEGSIGDCVLPQTSETPRDKSTENGERDFSYLTNLLIRAGFHDSAIEMVSGAYSLPECSVGSDIFEKLEVYDEPSSWLRCERKLLFDLINSILMERIPPHVVFHPWANSTRNLTTQSQVVLTDEVWQLLVKLRKELNDDPIKLLLDGSWLDVTNIIDVMGREMEEMLGSDLLDEVVRELLF